MRGIGQIRSVTFESVTFDIGDVRIGGFVRLFRLMPLARGGFFHAW